MGYQFDSQKPREKSKREVPFSATYVRQVLDGKEIVLVDYMANIFKVDGKDQLARYRKNIG